MDRKIIVTGDNSKTLLIPSIDETYHSTHGAINEANHVFIDAGLKFVSESKKQLNILEMGFGTGLNTLLTAINAEIHTHYLSIEKFPLSNELVFALDYPKLLANDNSDQLFESIHTCPWEKWTPINELFELKKMSTGIEELNLPDQSIDLIFYDAFGPRVQPELWSDKITAQIYSWLRENGVLVTYCAQGQFKRNLKNVGFDVETLPGPPGKREMTRAIKPKK